MKTVDLNIATTENRSRSPMWASQTLVNLYLDAQSSGRTANALMPWPGIKRLVASGSGENVRGCRTVNNRFYFVQGQRLRRLTEDLKVVDVGDVPGSDPLVFADDGFNLIIRLQGSVSYVNGKFICGEEGPTFIHRGSGGVNVLQLPNMPNPGQFCVSEVDNPSSFPASAVAEAIKDNDPLLQIFAHQNKIIMAGSRTIEFYYDSGEFPLPITPIENINITNLGVASRQSIAETPSSLYFLGSDGVVYLLNNFQVVSVTPSSIAWQISQEDISTAYCFTMQIDGNWFFIAKVGAKTLCFSEKTKTWNSLNTGIGAALENGIDRSLVCYGRAFNRDILFLRGEATIREWSYDVYDRDGYIAIVREFTTAPVTNQGKRMFCNRARFVLETGVGSSEEEDPVIIAQYSIDGGKTFSQEKWLKLGRRGESTRQVDWNFRVSFYDLVIRVKVSDPNFVSFHSATIDVREGGF